MFTVSSDFDETPDWRVYWESMRFLNTTRDTAMGPGLGLEIGNSIYFWGTFPHIRELTYWDTDDTGRAMFVALMKSGHVDTLHSFGHLARTRDDARRALEELERRECQLRVWVDHASAPHNFGADIMHGIGDLPGSPAYHADLTLARGIRYVNRGRTTSVTGQNVAPRLTGILTPAHPLASARTLAKEAAKRTLAALHYPKYAMHGPNRVLRDVRLRDGQPVQEFMRCNPYWGGVGEGDTGVGVADVLTPAFLERLVEREGVCILYTHLGKIRDRSEIFPASTRRAFQLLADAFRERRILVTTTHRLLRYLNARDRLRYRTLREGRSVVISLDAIDDTITGSRPCCPEELQGLTFLLPGAQAVEIRSEGVAIPCESTHHANRSYVSVPWRPLVFPEL